MNTNLRALYPSYVNNNISRTHTVFTTILLIDDGIVVRLCRFDSSAICIFAHIGYSRAQCNDANKRYGKGH